MSSTAMTWVLRGNEGRGQRIDMPPEGVVKGDDRIGQCACRTVLVVLADHSNDVGRTWTGAKRIAAETWMDEHDARRCLKVLEWNGLITEVKRGGGRGNPTCWQLNIGTEFVVHMAPRESRGSPSERRGERRGETRGETRGVSDPVSRLDAEQPEPEPEEGAPAPSAPPPDATLFEDAATPQLAFNPRTNGFATIADGVVADDGGPFDRNAVFQAIVDVCGKERARMTGPELSDVKRTIDEIRMRGCRGPDDVRAWARRRKAAEPWRGTPTPSVIRLAWSEFSTEPPTTTTDTGYVSEAYRYGPQMDIDSLPEGAVPPEWRT